MAGHPRRRGGWAGAGDETQLGSPSTTGDGWPSYSGRMLSQVAAFVTLTVLVAFAVSLSQDAPPTRPVRRWWDRHGGMVRWYVASAPATFTYLAILGVTTWVLLGMPDRARTMFIEAQSTNLVELSDRPIRALVRSAFFVSNTELVMWLALFASVLAPVERWLGTGRTVATFAVGHVVTTLLAAVDVWVHIRFLGAPASLAHVEDTGASYGFLTLATLLIYRLRGPSRWLLGTALAAITIYGAIEGTGFTARGHAMAVLLGLALVRMTRIPEVRARATGTSLLDLWRRASHRHRTPAQARARV